MTQKVLDLESAIKKYAEAYYLGEQIASDQEFDLLCDQLRNLDPDNQILNQVGFGLKIYGEKVALPLPIEKSLPKIKDITAFNSHPLQRVVITPKLDGLSVIVSRKDGVKQALTRGDGKYGVDITAKVERIHSLNAFFTYFRGDFCSRGELFVRPSVFNSVFSSEFANPRNLVAGIINRKSFENLEYVDFLPFDISFDFQNIKVGEKAKEALTTPYSVFVYSTSVERHNLSNKVLKDLYSWHKDKSDLPVDGLVLNGTVAWKDDNESVEAEVGAIEWNLSPLGRLIPVAVLKTPVNLYGTSVTRASAFNYMYVHEHKLGTGSKVRITKANEIIPYITQVDTFSPSYKAPSYCPLCNNATTLDGVHITCKSCYNPLESAIVGFIEAFLLPKGVQQVDKIVSRLGIKTPSDIKLLINPTPEVKFILALVLGTHKSNLLINHCQSLSSIDTKKFLSSLSLPALGEVASEEVSYYIFDYVNYGFEFISSKVKVNQPAQASLIRYHELIKSFYTSFVNYLHKVEHKTYLYKVCVTGKLSESRNEFNKKLESAGIKLTESLDKDTILVTNNSTSGSSKNKKAKELGIEIISEEEARSRWLKNAT